MVDPRWNLISFTLRRHYEGKLITNTSLALAAEVPYGTAIRRINELLDEGLLLKRARSRTGKSYSLHPTAKLIEIFEKFAFQLKSHIGNTFGFSSDDTAAGDFYFGGSYMKPSILPFPSVMEEGIGYDRVIRILSPSDPTFKSLSDFSSNLNEFCGGRLEVINLSLDELHEEIILNSQRAESNYDIIALDIPWLGELAESGSVLPLGEMIAEEKYRYSDFHSTAWKGSGYNSEPYALPIQPTAELLFYRTDLFEEAGLAPPESTDDVLAAAQALHRFAPQLSGIVMNYGPGTPVGHTFIQTQADFGSPIIQLPRLGKDFKVSDLKNESYRPQIDSEAGHRSAEFLLELLEYAHPESLACNWDRRIKLFSEGQAAMTYGWSIRARVFEFDESCPAHGNVGYRPHPPGPGARTVSPIGGFSLAIPANQSDDRIRKAWKMMKYLTSPELMKWYAQNGSLSSPRFSTSADPEVRALSKIIVQLDDMEKNGQLQLWPRPPIPEFNDIVQIIGEEIHPMLKGDVSIDRALKNAQKRVDSLMRSHGRY
ncbi:sugar ABC transporter substrate-binding protein [Marinobacterium nitratireducens]|uniref:Sugar ABC transporter substrate-binding protein n=2 Tax=Marinobacterium nitratireducens TaxID=518897 RepID=A0A918DWX9_9GAMM|nr:sugar ABC transporter substrate-binding protein [Marinobacterium nitratireducens]